MAVKPTNEEQTAMLLSECCKEGRIGDYYGAVVARNEEECITSALSSIFSLKRQGRESEARAFIMQGLLTLSKAFNRGVGMSAEQLALTIDLFMEDPMLPNMKLDDIKLCFRRAMTGEYGECYGLDPSTIMIWLKKYWKGRCDAAERVTIREQKAERDRPVEKDAAWHQAVQDLARHMSEWRGQRKQQR